MIDENKITEAVNAYIGYPKEIDEGVGTFMRPHRNHQKMMN